MGNATKETELPEYLKKLILEKFIFGVTYALISVLLMVLLFMSHTNILSEIMVQSLPRGTEEKALWVWQKVVVKWIIGNGVNMSSTLKKKNYLLLLERERGEEGGERNIDLSTFSCSHWLVLVCALTGDRTCSLRVSGWRSDQQHRTGAELCFCRITMWRTVLPNWQKHLF